MVVVLIVRGCPLGLSRQPGMVKSQVIYYIVWTVFLVLEVAVVIMRKKMGEQIVDVFKRGVPHGTTMLNVNIARTKGQWTVHCKWAAQQPQKIALSFPGLFFVQKRHCSESLPNRFFTVDPSSSFVACFSHLQCLQRARSLDSDDPIAAVTCKT
jgi:hypothetical protein